VTLHDEYCVWGIYYVTLRDLFYMNNYMIGNATLVVSEFVQDWTLKVCCLCSRNDLLGMNE